MSLSSQSTQQKLPFPYDAVFDGVVSVIPQAGFKLKSQDKVIGRITASAGISLFSWGENLTIVVEKIDDRSTLVGIESGLKVGVNLAGVHRHAKNFDKLIAALSTHLQSRTGA
jgi:hypothetical protein